jgi:hypothetical protein
LAFGPPFVVSFVFAAIVSLIVLRLSRTQLDVSNTFPELLKIPGLRWFLGA